ncbi:MAG: hypothetical protein H8E85_08285 [Candidatus Marinimicrobia bacterium]|nr:hypothetical protein [Candidatus Neomarinimicrobiota bacterium]
MELQKFGIKLFFKPNSSYPSKEFIPVFHNWIQTNSVPEHMLIDVIDYSHIPDGPGIMLIAHEGHFSLDKENNMPGILYSRKAKIVGDFQKRFESVFGSSLQAAKLLQNNEIVSGVDFQSNSFRFISNDRLLAENNKENQELFSNTIDEMLIEKYPNGKWVIDDYSQEGERLAFTVKFQDDINIMLN